MILLSELWKQRCTAYGFFPKGKVTDLSNGFALGGVPFTVFVRPKEVTMETSTLLKCKLICDKNLVCSQTYRDWTPGAIAVISPNGIDLLYMMCIGGAGETIK